MISDQFTRHPPLTPFHPPGVAPLQWTHLLAPVTPPPSPYKSNPTLFPYPGPGQGLGTTIVERGLMLMLGAIARVADKQQQQLHRLYRYPAYSAGWYVADAGPPPMLDLFAPTWICLWLRFDFSFATVSFTTWLKGGRRKHYRQMNHGTKKPSAAPDLKFFSTDFWLRCVGLSFCIIIKW